MKNAYFAEQALVKMVTEPVDGNTAAITGGRIGLKLGQRVAFLINMGDSTSATAVTFTLKQHNAASSGTSKALSVANKYYHKVGAATKFTQVEPGSAASAYDLTTEFASEPGLVILEVAAEDLDVNNGFAWASVDIADTGAAKLLSVLAVVKDPHFFPAYSQDT